MLPYKKLFLFTALLSLRLVSARTLSCYDPKENNSIVGGFVLTVSPDSLKIEKLELSKSQLSSLSESDITSLRRSNTFSDESTKVKNFAAAFGFDFAGVPDPYNPQHPPRIYKGYSRYKKSTSVNAEAYAYLLTDLAHIVIRPEFVQEGNLPFKRGKLADVVFQYVERESGSADYFNCY